MLQDISQREIGLRLKWLRQERKVSLRQLAAKSGIAASHISKIEAGNASPTVMALQRILNAMDLDVYEFFQNPSNQNTAERVVFSKENMEVVQDGDRKWSYAFPKSPDIQMQLTFEEHQPHTSAFEKESYGGDICGIVLSGELTLEVIMSGEYKASAGDAFYVKAGKLHAGRNDGDEPLVIVAVQQL